MPPLTAAIEDTNYAFPAGTYESLFLQVGCNSTPLDDALLVLFSPVQGKTRLDYSLLVSYVESYGFAVIMMDHPFDADVVQFPDGSYIIGLTFNSTTSTQVDAAVITGIDVRVQDMSFVLDQLENEILVHQLIPEHTCTP